MRVHLMQNLFEMSDTAMEEALYEITPMRTLVRLECRGKSRAQRAN